MTEMAIYRAPQATPRAHPTEFALREFAKIQQLLETPPANRSSEELLAERERIHREVDAADHAQGCLHLGGGQ